MPDRSDELRAQQMAFAAHLRDPEHQPAPRGIEDRRLQIYRDLFLGNLVSLLGSSFPILRKIYGKDAWRDLVRQFFVQHRSHTPIFAEIPNEFLSFLKTGLTPGKSDPPFLLELAHYEWAELALSTRDAAISWESIDRNGDLLAGPPVVSPLAWSLAYQFPVHRISADYRPAAPGAEPTRLLIYRDLSDAVGFIEINVVTARLLELAKDNPRSVSGRELLLKVAGELQHPKPQTVVSAGTDMLQTLHRKDVILGTWLS